MSDIKLFSLGGVDVAELTGRVADLEKDLQKLIERHMEVFLGVRFVATEYSTGKTHKGRIDSLGLDENDCPVIIEYKRHRNQNVINQGLFYLDWLLDHQAEFQLLVMKKYGEKEAERIEWDGARLICIAADFNKYDEHAVQQIRRNIDLMRYRYFGDELLLLELVNSQTVEIGSDRPKGGPAPKRRSAGVVLKSHPADKTQIERLSETSDELKQVFNLLCEFASELGDDVQRKDLKLYTAFKRIKNFLSIVILPTKKDPRLQLYLKLDPNEVDARYGDLVRDVTSTGHWGTGDLEVVVRSRQDLERVFDLIQTSHERN